MGAGAGTGGVAPSPPAVDGPPPPPQADSIRMAATTVAAKPRGRVSQGRFIAVCTSSLWSRAANGLRPTMEAHDAARPVRLGSPSFANPEAWRSSRAPIPCVKPRMRVSRPDLDLLHARQPFRHRLV